MEIADWLQGLSPAWLLVAGGLGAFVKLCVKEGYLEIPKFEGGKLYLNALGGIMIGAIIGVLVDHSGLTAFLAGYTGPSIIETWFKKTAATVEAAAESVEDMIRRIAREEAVDAELAVRVAKAESSLDPLRVNVNAPDSIDRGLYQINSKWHPEVTEAQAFDPEFAARFFCKALKEGHLSWWDASRSNWET